MLLRITAVLLLVTSAFFLLRAVDPIVGQNRKVRQWEPVEATVTAQFVDRKAPRRAGSGAAADGAATTRPFELAVAPQLEVKYRYEVDRTIYTVTDPDPRAEEWLPAGPKLVTERQASYARRGYYDPARPRDLFFPKAFGLGDYWLIFFWAPVLGLGFGGLVLRKPGRSVRALPGPGANTAERGWRRLAPKYSIRHRTSGAWGVAIVCTLILGWAAYDYFTGEPRTRSTTSDMLVGVAMLPGVITLALAVYYTWMSRRVGDARVWVNTPRAAPGERFAVKVELPVKADVDLEHVVVSLACVRSQFEGPRLRFTERVIWEERVERAIARRRAPAGGRIEFEQRFELPADADPGFAGGIFGPWIDWEIRVEFHLDNGPDYRGKFPLAVHVERPAAPDPA